jgi:hypothetical protein
VDKELRDAINSFNSYEDKCWAMKIKPQYVVERGNFKLVDLNHEREIADLWEKRGESFFKLR